MQDKFSKLALEVRLEEEELAFVNSLKSSMDFSDKQKTEENKKKRVKKIQDHPGEFARTYFPPSVHKTGYAKPNQMMRDIDKMVTTPGFHFVIGPRGYAKSVRAKMDIVWLFITGRLQFLSTYSETLDKARSLKKTISRILANNPRLQTDFNIKFERDNDDETIFRINGERCIIKPYSEDRSVRGAGDMFERPDFVVADDVETYSSSFTEDIVERRYIKMKEAFQSLSPKATMLVLANNLHQDSVANMLLRMKEDGKLQSGFNVHHYQAWNTETNEPLWAERFPANSEEELQALHNADAFDWSANFQGRPEKDGGYLFPEEFWTEYDTIPDDARGVAYCDPNLALKTDSSDYTAIGALWYSPKENNYYVVKPRCKQMSDSEELITAFLQTFSPGRTFVMGFDGWVDQEARWTDTVRLYASKHQIAVPYIKYYRFKVDQAAKLVQVPYRESRILFPKNGWHNQQEKEAFKRQITRFKSKKGKTKGQKVDAADWLICAFNVIYDPEIMLGERLIQPDFRFQLGSSSDIEF